MDVGTGGIKDVIEIFPGAEGPDPAPEQLGSSPRQGFSVAFTCGLLTPRIEVHTSEKVCRVHGAELGCFLADAVALMMLSSMVAKCLQAKQPNSGDYQGPLLFNPKVQISSSTGTSESGQGQGTLLQGNAT